MADRIEAIVALDVPVMGHVGLTPQSVHRMGGYRVQGAAANGRDQLLRDAQAVQEAGRLRRGARGHARELAAEVTGQPGRSRRSGSARA